MHHANRFLHCRLFIHTAVQPQRFCDLFSAFDNRIERGHGFLKNHRNLISPDLLHLFFLRCHQILVPVQDTSVCNLTRGIGNQLHDSQGGDALSTAALSYDTQLFSFM